MKWGLLAHTYNESLLMEGWVRHHVGIFDEATIVDHHSSDDSLDIVRTLAPHWKIVKSRLSGFDCTQTDIEMMEYEDQVQADFKQILNITEWVWTPNYREKVEQHFKDHPKAQALGMRSFCLVDKPITPAIFGMEHTEWALGTYDHHWGLLDKFFGVNVPRHHRFVHRAGNGQYSVGRHSTSLPNHFAEDLFLLHWTFAPWPQAIERKMQIQTRMPDHDKQAGRGIQHIQSYESLMVTYHNWLAEAGDLLLDNNFKDAYDYYRGAQ